MKVLVFYPYIPYPIDRGTFQRAYHLLRGIAREHEVDFLSLTENGERVDQAGHFEEFCNRVKFIPFEHPPWPKLFPDRLLNKMPTSIRHWQQPHIQQEVDEFLKGADYDFVHVCDIVLLPYLFDKHDLPIAVDRSRVDLQYQMMQVEARNPPLRDKLLDWEGILKVRWFEKYVARRVNMEVVCGPDDIVFIRDRISKNVPVSVIGNGVDLDFFQPDSVPDKRAENPTVLFCGAMDYVPNTNALEWFFTEIFADLKKRVPDLEILLVGRSPTDTVKSYGSKPGVTVTGGVPDVRPFYRRSWMQIVPLRIGGGTRLKIVESMAIGTPVISTTIGAQGLGIKHDHDILLADTPAEFVTQTERALADSDLRDQLDQEGQKTATDRFSWKFFGKQLCGEYQKAFG